MSLTLDVYADYTLNDEPQPHVDFTFGFWNLNPAPCRPSTLALPSPLPPGGSFNREAATRGAAVFSGKAGCATCHVPPLFTEPGWNTHKTEEIGIDDFQANRSPDRSCRTAPLKGLWAHSKGGFYHDGRFAQLIDVVNHYDTFQQLGLSDQEKRDLVEYLKSL